MTDTEDLARAQRIIDGLRDLFPGPPHADELAGIVSALKEKTSVLADSLSGASRVLARVDPRLGKMPLAKAIEALVQANDSLARRMSQDIGANAVALKALELLERVTGQRGQGEGACPQPSTKPEERKPETTAAPVRPVMF